VEAAARRAAPGLGAGEAGHRTAAAEAGGLPMARKAAAGLRTAAAVAGAAVRRAAPSLAEVEGGHRTAAAAHLPMARKAAAGLRAVAAAAADLRMHAVPVSDCGREAVPVAVRLPTAEGTAVAPEEAVAGQAVPSRLEILPPRVVAAVAAAVAALRPRSHPAGSILAVSDSRLLSLLRRAAIASSDPLPRFAFDRWNYKGRPHPRQSAGLPYLSSARAMTTLWIWLVPS
jgi:hypothetical protein